jgi:hypothetical protein
MITRWIAIKEIGEGITPSQLCGTFIERHTLRVTVHTYKFY